MSSKSIPQDSLLAVMKRNQDIAVLCQEAGQCHAMVYGLEQAGFGNSDTAKALRELGGARGKSLAEIFAPKPLKKTKSKAKGLAKTAPSANAS